MVRKRDGEGRKDAALKGDRDDKDKESVCP